MPSTMPSTLESDIKQSPEIQNSSTKGNDENPLVYKLDDSQKNPWFP